jgi:hypothetical protein
MLDIALYRNSSNEGKYEKQTFYFFLIHFPTRWM